MVNLERRPIRLLTCWPMLPVSRRAPLACHDHPHRIFDPPLENDGFQERIVELCPQPCPAELGEGRIG